MKAKARGRLDCGHVKSVLPRLSSLVFGALCFLSCLLAQLPVEKATPPTRDPHTPGYVEATELSDGALPSPKVNGNFIVGPTHTPAPEMSPDEAVPQGTIYTFTMESKDSKLYPGIARDAGTFGTPDPNDAAKLIVTTSHPEPYTRKIASMFQNNTCPERSHRSLSVRTGRPAPVRRAR